MIMITAVDILSGWRIAFWVLVVAIGALEAKVRWSKFRFIDDFMACDPKR